MGMEMPAFREQMQRQMIVQRYLSVKKEDNFKSIRMPTEVEITNQYNLARSQFVRPETVRFSMIQVPYGQDAAARTRARTLADNLAREIGTNASKFDEVVVRGQAPNSGYLSGDGGFLPRNHEALSIVGQEFMNTAFSLRQGEVSRLIEGVPGYQIIKITESYTMRNLELDDLFMLGTRMTVRDYIGNVLLEERQQMTLAQASEELITELRRGNPFRVFENNLNW
jgi:parvulin-like peptidyl-prolyl isomerase